MGWGWWGRMKSAEDEAMKIDLLPVPHRLLAAAVGRELPWAAGGTRNPSSRPPSEPQDDPGKHTPPRVLGPVSPVDS